MESKTLKRANTTESKEYRKNTILEAATQLFFDNPTQLPTVSAISKACGIAKGTIYIYFTSKEEIFLEIINNLFKEFVSNTDNIVRESENKEDKIEYIISSLCDYYNENSMLVILAGFSNVIIEHNIDIDAATDHKISLQKQVLELGCVLAEIIDRDELFCASLLLRTYAITIGIARVSILPKKVKEIHKNEGAQFIAPEFRNELYNTLKPFWIGSLS